MKKSATSTAVVAATILEDAWQEVGASFERFCLTAGITTLASMMEEDAAQLCGPRHGRVDGKSGYRWGKTTGKAGFHGGKVEIERPRVRSVENGGEMTLPSWQAALSEDLPGKWALNPHFSHSLCPAPVQNGDRAGERRRAMWFIGQAVRRTLSPFSTGPKGRLAAAACERGPLDRMARYAFRVPPSHPARRKATQGAGSVRNAG